MVRSGPPNQIGGSQSVSLQMLGAQQGGGLSSQRIQFDDVNMLGSVPKMSSLIHQSFGNGVISGPGGSNQRGIIDAGGQVQGQQFSNPSANNLLSHQPQQLDGQAFQHGQQSMQQYSGPHSTQQVQQQNQFQTIRGGSGAVGPVTLEQKATIDQHGAQQQQQQLRNNLGSVKLDPQQMQQFLHMSRQSSPSAAAQFNLLHQQRLLQIQQHQQQQQQQQQQQLLKSMPQQRPQLQQQFQPQNLPQRSPAKPVYEPGMCARRLTRYMYQQQHRPEDNNIEFWRKFVAEYFAPNARKKWCVSMYGSGRQASGVFPQDVWHCEICNRKPGRGFEATAEVLPRLYKIKYESGTLEELLYVDMPHEYPNSSGQIVLDYAKAIQESVFDQLRVVREGQLRIIFSPELKICSWEFCARRHEELIPRKLLTPQVSQLGAAAQKYQSATQNQSSNLSSQELLNNCNEFVASARQLAKALEVPLVNDLGYTKRYVRCLQISEVVNSMKDLIDCSRETQTGPMECLAKFPRRTSASSRFNGQSQQPEEQQQQQQPLAQQQVGANNVANPAGTIAGLLIRQNSMNSRQHSLMNNAGSPYAGTSAQDPSAPGSSSTVPQPQPNPPPQMVAHNGAIDQGESQSSVQKLIHNMMMSTGNNNNNNANGVMMSTGNNNNNNNANNAMMNGGLVNGSGIGGFGSMANGMRAAMGNNNNSLMNGRMSMNHQQQQDLSNQFLSGIGAMNGFNNLQFDWKPSP
ncbi:Transcriptional corepressor SEUSS [Linum grandiflorum]